MLLAYEPTGDLAEPSPHGLRLLGIEVTRRPKWPAMRHVWDLGEFDAGLHVEIGPYGDASAFAVGYTLAAEEMLTPI